MKAKFTVTNSESLSQKFKGLGRKGKNATVIVGYTANYAVYVHEAVGMKLKGVKRSPPGKGKYWDPQGRAQAKFLEEPARTMKDEIAKDIGKAYNNGASFEDSLYLGGLRLQRESQLRVPVDTGNLKNSAFTRKA